MAIYQLLTLFAKLLILHLKQFTATLKSLQVSFKQFLDLILLFTGLLDLFETVLTCLSLPLFDVILEVFHLSQQITPLLLKLVYFFFSSMQILFVLECHLAGLPLFKDVFEALNLDVF